MKVRIHFSFWLLILTGILFKQGYLVGLYSIAMLLHECCHAVVLRYYCYRCNEVCLSAFGAVINLDDEVTCDKHNIIVALAGPIGNVITCVILVALWWVAPTTYVFTYEFCSANLSMAIINMLPCYPLDGGRVFESIVHKRNCSKTATAITAVVLLVTFVVGLCFGQVLYSLLTFSVFLISGLFGEQQGKYVKISPCVLTTASLVNGVEKKVLVFNKNATVCNVIKKLKGNYLYNVEVVDDSLNVIARYNSSQLSSIITSVQPDVTLDKIVHN